MQITRNKRSFAIVIIVKRETEVKKLYISDLRFGRFTRVVEKYWKARPSLVYMTCYRIGHKKIRGYGNKLAKCMICI